MSSSRWLLALLLLLALLAGATSARAQDDPGADTEKSYESPQRFWVEFRLGPYIPGIDGEFGGRATPYRDLFGEGKNIMFTWEGEVEVWRPFGTLAVGGSFGYFTNSAKGINEQTGELTGSDSTLQLFPLAALVVYRFDWAADHWRIPLVPYFKFGFNYTFWWMQLDGELSSFQRADGTVVDARGGSFGWQINAGMAFRLDIVEPGAARALDAELGINHTYLFFEFSHVAANGMGASSALGLGDTTWSGGLAFEF
jgi:hypothetical protein